MTRKRRLPTPRQEREEKEEKREAGARMEPLLCAKCGAPQAIGDEDSVRCRGCGTTTPLPAEHRMLRDAHRLSANDAAQLDALYADVSRPPPAWARVAVVIGYGVGILTLVVLAIGAIIGAVGGAIIGDKTGSETLTKILAGAGAILVGFISVPYAGEWVIGFLVHFDGEAATALVSSPRMHVSTDLGVAAFLYFLGIVPIALAWRTSQKISGIEELQAKLAAAPPIGPKGTASCRMCGAPLDAKPGALGTRCLYCGADNLLAVPHADAKKKKDDASAIDVEVQAAVASNEATKRDDRATMWLLLGLGLLLAPLLCAAGWVMHKILAA